MCTCIKHQHKMTVTLPSRKHYNNTNVIINTTTRWIFHRLLTLYCLMFTLLCNSVSVIPQKILIRLKIQPLRWSVTTCLLPGEIQSSEIMAALLTFKTMVCFTRWYPCCYFTQGGFKVEYSIGLALVVTMCFNVLISKKYYWENNDNGNPPHPSVNIWWWCLP